MAIFIFLALGLLSTPASMVTPYSVNANGLAVFGRFEGYVITDCDDIVFHSSEGEYVAGVIYN